MVMETKGIGFTLFGNNLVYTRGMLENCHLARRYYPDWQVYIYIDYTTERKTLERLLDAGAIIRRRPCKSKWMNRSGRYFIVEEVERFIIRDADSRIGHREVMAVNEWIESGKPFHFMHDHENHRPPIMGGMWGAVSTCMPEGYLYELENFQATDWGVCQDQVFIKRHLWDKITPDDYLHHRSAGFECGHSVPFPTQMLGREFIGDTYYKVNHLRSVIRIQDRLPDIT